MTRNENNVKKEQERKSNNNYYFQIDLLKAFIIIFVISEHALPWDIKNYMAVFLWQRLSIPFFMVILGFNMGLSFKRTGETSLKKLYSWKYFKKKLWRYVFPYLVFYAISIIVGLMIYGNLETIVSNQLYPLMDERFLYLGISPFWGPGIWFMPILFQTILLMPLIYKGFSSSTSKALITLILCFIINFVTHVSLFFFMGPTVDSLEEWRNISFFYISITMYLGGIGLGMWFSRNPSIFNVRNIFMWFLFPLCAYYIILFQIDRHLYQIDFIRGDYNIIFYTYVAFILLIILKIIPKNPQNKLAKGISWIGKSSYHILLSQIFYFGLMKAFLGDAECMVGATDPGFCILYDIIAIIICVLIGVLWGFSESKVRNYRLNKKKAK
ncbi:MAG: acyltransferase [Promethearchaeota archaeon]|nr:MAG: acyltransferase [Candidatus Lokiarchaeota archaeon]